MTSTWRGPLLTASLIAALAFAGCGGDDDSSDTGTVAAPATTTVAGRDFCTKLENIGKNLSGEAADMADPTKLGTFFAQGDDALKPVDPPSEIQEKWQTLEDLFASYADTFSKIDLTDPQSLAGLQDVLKQFQDKQDEITSATTALSQYAADNCGGAFGGS